MKAGVEFKEDGSPVLYLIVRDSGIGIKDEDKSEKDDRIMVIMDDCMASKGTWLKDPNILELFFNGRHHHLSFILTMQFSLGIPPELTV